MKIVNIVTLDLDHFNFYCPVTGHAMSGGTEFSASPATAFVYLDEIGEFISTSSEVESVINEIDPANNLYGDEIFPKLSEYLQNPSLTCFVLNVHGVACCGPMSSTVRIGINMNYQSET